MVKNYLLVAFRNFVHEKSYVIINIFGLALAIGCAIVLLVYIRSEMTFDQHHVSHERIYRIVSPYVASGKSGQVAVTSPVLGPLLKREYPNLFDFVRFRKMDKMVFRVDDVGLYWPDVLMVDANVFEVFTHQRVHGDLSTSLSDPSSIAISESFSKAVFGERNPIGETLTTDSFDYQVSAVFADLPDNSHLKYEALVSMERMWGFGYDDQKVSVQEVLNASLYTYLLVYSDHTQKELQHALDDFYKTKIADIAKQFRLDLQFIAQPLKDIHFESGWDYDEPIGNIFYVYGFVAVAVFILLIACINYTNLATARATKRAKEVGMRKILGATQGQLVLQL